MKENRKIPGIDKARLVQIAEAVCVLQGISIEDLRGKARFRHLVYARKLFAYAVGQIYPDITYVNRGLYLGKDHSTICHYISEIEGLMDTYFEDREMITGRLEAIRRMTDNERPEKLACFSVDVEKVKLNPTNKAKTQLL
jgi:chromosomal replication initiation ATPase DnaA